MDLSRPDDSTIDQSGPSAGKLSSEASGTDGGTQSG